MRLLHNLTHRHVVAYKEDVGEFRFCMPVLGGRRPHPVYFRPADGDRWHKIPGPLSEDASEVYLRMLFAAGSHEAMSILRAAKAEAGRYA